MGILVHNKLLTLKLYMYKLTPTLHIGMQLLVKRAKLLLLLIMFPNDSLPAYHACSPKFEDTFGLRLTCSGMLEVDRTAPGQKECWILYVMEIHLGVFDNFNKEVVR